MKLSPHGISTLWVTDWSCFEVIEQHTKSCRRAQKLDMHSRVGSTVVVVPNQTLDCCFLELCLLKHPRPQKVSRSHPHFQRLLKNQSIIVIFSSVSYRIEIRSVNIHYVTCSTLPRVRIVCLWVSCHRLMPNTTQSVFEYTFLKSLRKM